MFSRWITAACRGQGAMVEITNHMGMLASESICLLLGPVEISILRGDALPQGKDEIPELDSSLS